MNTYTATIATGETVARTTKTAWTHIIEFTRTVQGTRNNHRDAIANLTKAAKKRGANVDGIAAMIATETAALAALDGRDDAEVLSVTVYQWSKSADAAQTVVDAITADGHRARAIALTVN